VPTDAVAGKPDRSGVMSEPAVAMTVEPVLFAGLPSLVAVVVPLTVDDPVLVGVPETVQTICAPAATVVGGVGVQDVVKPEGRPLTAHVALVAASEGEPAFEHVKVPE
jgi:hypothetical protein